MIHCPVKASWAVAGEDPNQPARIKTASAGSRFKAETCLAFIRDLRASGLFVEASNLQFDQLIYGGVIESARLGFLDKSRAHSVDSHRHELIGRDAVVALGLNLFDESRAYAMNAHCYKLIDRNALVA